MTPNRLEEVKSPEKKLEMKPQNVMMIDKMRKEPISIQNNQRD